MTRFPFAALFAALVAALFTAAPLAAFAQPVAENLAHKTITGRIKVTPVLCVTTPCYPLVEIVDDNSNRTSIRGNLLRDVESLAGQGDVTVQGWTSGGSLDVTALAPGRGKSFVTGVVTDLTYCESPDDASTCDYAVELQPLDGGEPVRITQEKTARGLSKMDGAIVSVKGTRTNTPCPPSAAVCIQLYQPTLWPHPQANVWVKGNLSDALIATTWAPGVEPARYFARFQNGNEGLVYTTKNWANRLGTDVWMSGSFDGDKFRATKAGRSVWTDEIPVEPMPWDGVPLSGTNVQRGQATDAVAGADRPAAGGAQGAGMARN